MPSHAQISEKYAALVESLRRLDSAVVAFSGGVDSAFLLRAAVDALGPSVRAVIGVSPSVPEEILERARKVASELGVALDEVETGEMDRPEYVANAPDRCFHCKSALYSLLDRLQRESGGAAVLDGTNHDDLSDVRPGLRAAREWGVRSPLAENGWTKAEIRDASRSLGLETWDRPASPCLSSRIPHGTPVTLDALRGIGAAERALRRLGFQEVRIRHHGTMARIEVPARDIAAVAARAPDIVAAVVAAGYAQVVLDLAGYRQGGADPATEDSMGIVADKQGEHGG